jgi:polar amino acid transport system ATP-binding protein
MIRIEHLAKSYGNFPVLKDINAEIQRGEVISIIGPSGAGKSTFLRCLNLLEQPTQGAIWFAGVNLLDPRTEVTRYRQKMNMVFQSFNLFAHLSVMDNLTLAPIRLRGQSRSAAEQRAIDLLRTVGLVEKAGRFPHELSGGQQQRIAIARCLAMDPEVILFDEPTSALDPIAVGEVLPVIRRLAREGMTMVVVTHEMDFARDVAHRAWFMEEGGLYEQGTPAEIFGNPQREKTRAFIQRIRYFQRRFQSRDYDVYGLQADLAAFCDAQALAPEVAERLRLVIDETLQRAPRLLDTPPLDLSIGYSEKTQEIELVWQAAGPAVNPLEPQSPSVPDPVATPTESLDTLVSDLAYSRVDDRNVLRMRLRQR